MVNNQILFMRSAKKPEARWLFQDEDSGLLKLCNNRADGDNYTESALAAVQQKIPLIWKNPEQREAWIHVIPVTMSDAEVLEKIAKWREENPFTPTGAKPKVAKATSDTTPSPDAKPFNSGVDY